MADSTVKEQDKKRTINSSMILLALLPLIALAGVILLFLNTGGGLNLKPPAPVEDLTFERTVLEPNAIVLSVRNSGPQPVTIAQALVNDAVWPFQAQPSATIPRLGRATITVPYHWSYAESYAVTLFTSSSLAFSTDIPVAFVTPKPTAKTFLSYTLIGLYVGVIPVYLGIVWLPFLRQIGRKWMTFLLAVTIGLLVFLGIDTLMEAFDQSAAVPGPFQSAGLIGIGAVTTFLILYLLARRQENIGRKDESQRMSLAYMIALGIGVHNLGEGLAIGAAYSVGEIALGAFLVVGFIIQNITEGLGIIAPVARDRPTIRQLIVMGLVGGGPAILGAWLGGFAPSPTLAVLFLAIGAGAIFEVVYEIAQMMRKDTQAAKMPVALFTGVTAGMLLLWVTGLLIK
jgi:ZIP family zinc transporter